MPYLLDTNVWIHYLKHPGSPIHAKLATLQPDDVEFSRVSGLTVEDWLTAAGSA